MSDEAREIAKEVIKHFEGCHLKSYVLPGETWATIGWGCAIPLKQHPRFITQEDADKMLDTMLDHKIVCIHKEVAPQILDSLPPKVRAGIYSFRYNVKDSAWLMPTCRTRAALVKGDIKAFALLMLLWDKGEKGPLPGLKRRRRVENELVGSKSLREIKAKNWYQAEYK